MASRNVSKGAHLIRGSYRGSSPGGGDEDVPSRVESRLPFRRTQGKPSLSRTPSPSVALPPYSASKPEVRELSSSLGASSRGGHVFASLERHGSHSALHTSSHHGTGLVPRKASPASILPSPKLKKNFGRKSPPAPDSRDSGRRRDVKKGEGHRDTVSVASHVSKSVRLRSGSQGTEMEALGDADDPNVLFSKYAMNFQEETTERSPRERDKTHHIRKGQVDDGNHKENAGTNHHEQEDVKFKSKNRCKSAPSDLVFSDSQTTSPGDNEQEDECHDDWGGVSLGDLSSLGFDDFLSQIKSVDDIERFKQALDARKNHLQKRKPATSNTQQQRSSRRSGRKHKSHHRSKGKSSEEPLPITPRSCEPLFEEPLKPTATFATANSAALVSAAVSLSSCDGSLSPSGGSSMSGSQSYRRYDEGDDLAKEIKVINTRKQKGYNKSYNSNHRRFEGARAPDDKMFSSHHDDRYDDFVELRNEYDSDGDLSPLHADRYHMCDKDRAQEIREGLRRRGYNAPASDTSSLTSTSTVGRHRGSRMSKKKHGSSQNNEDDRPSTSRSRPACDSSRGSSPCSAWSCCPSPRSPTHLTDKPPPSFVPRIRLEAMRAVETASREGGSAPRGTGSDLALPSPRSAFSPREE